MPMRHCRRAAALALATSVIIASARAATDGSGSAADAAVGACNATAFRKLYTNVNVDSCVAKSRFSFTFPTAAVTNNAEAICSVGACSAVFKTLRRLQLPECLVTSTVRLKRDILTPLSQWTDCSAGLEPVDDDTSEITAPPKVSVPTTQAPNHHNSGSSHAVVIICGIVGGGLTLVLLALSSAWWKRRPMQEDLDKDEDEVLKIHELSMDDDDATSSFTTTTTTVGAVVPNRGPPTDSLWHDEELLKWYISVDGLEDIRVIGTGGFAVVYLVRDRRGRLLASKRLVHDHLTRDKTRALTAEIKLVATLAHPCIVQFIGAAWTTEADLQALFEYMPNGDLCTFLAKTSRDDEREVWDRTKLKMAIDIADALVYVHSLVPPLVHRDLKSRNVLLGERFDAKLSDFGVSRYQSDAMSMTTGVGTGRWLAPEVMNGGGEYNESCDIYSLGMVLVELDSHRLPFADLGMPEIAMLQLLSSGQLKPTLRLTCPRALQTLVLQCLSFDPLERPSAVQVAATLRYIAETEFWEE